MRTAVVAALLIGAIVSAAPLARAQCGDVNLDGAVDAGDPQALQAFLADPGGSPLSPGGYEQCTVYGGPRPCDLIDAVVLQRSVTGAGLPPGLGNGCADGDGDGVDDADDPCPRTPEGVPALAGEPGCAVLDAILRPRDLVDPALERLDEASLLLNGPDLADTHALLAALGDAAQAWSLELHGSADALPDGYPTAYCSGLWDDAESELTQARTLVDEQVDAIRAIVAADDGLPYLSSPPLEEELPDAQVLLLSFELGLERIDEAIAEIGRAASALDAACAANTGPLSARLRVLEIDDAARLLRVQDPASGVAYPLALPPDANLSQVSAGTLADVGGLGLGSNGALGNDVTPVDPGSPEDAQAACLFLRVAPPQGFAPWSAEPLELDAIEGYERTAGDAVLERNARFAVLSGGCPTGNPPLSLLPFTRYSMEIAVEYPAGLPDGQQTRLVPAPDLLPGDAPVALPVGLPNGITADLIATVRTQTCQLTGFPLGISCGPFSEHRVETHEITVVPTSSLCTATYYTTLVDLEDNDLNGFRNTFAISLGLDTTVLEPGTGPQFDAQACLPAPNATSCSNGQYVHVSGAGFIPIYNHDFFPIHGTTTPLQLYLAGVKHGVSVPGGVRWPRVRGTRSGREFHYACVVPRVVRDVVDYCTAPATEHSYYRLPYYPGGPGGPGQWHLAKGNSDQTPGHKGLQIFAFDFDALEGSEIRAARGGRVALLREDGAINDKACWDEFSVSYKACVDFATGGGASQQQAKTDCMNAWISYFGRPCDLGNYLYIRHQDGTYSNYFHMVQNSLPVSLGQIVHRSDPVGDAGNTGASGGPHLHYHVQTTNGVDTSSSIRIRFQTANQTCMIPANGDQSLSSNDPLAFY